MPHTTVAVWWKSALIVAAVMAAALAGVSAERGEIGAGLVLAVLVLVAAFLRIETPEGAIGFESAVAFGALVALHSPEATVLAVFTGSAAFAVYLGATRREPFIDAFTRAAELTIAFGIIGVLYSAAVARNAEPVARMAGLALMLAGYAAVAVMFAAVGRRLEDGDAQLDVRRLLLGQARVLLFVTPVVIVETMLYSVWGVPGFAVGFIPVVTLAFALRNEAEAGQQNAELMRRNRELALLTESSTQILSAESDEETLRRVTSLLSKLARMKACAFVTWEPHPDVPGRVYRFGECERTDQDILRWVDSTGFSQSAPSRAFVFQSDMRKFPLSSGNAIQVLIGIQTPEVIYGILLFETEDVSILKAGSLNLLTLLVNQTALSLQDQLLRREMREKTTQLEENAATMDALLGVSRSLIGEFEIDAALTRIALAIRSAVGFNNVVIAVLDARKDAFVRRAQAGMDEVWEDARQQHVPAREIAQLLKPEFRISNSYFISHIALRKNERDFFVRPEDAEERLLKQDEWHENDTLIVPLASGDQVLGYVWVRAPQDKRVPPIEKLRTLEVFANQARTALQTASQFEEIRRLTIIDSLTPAYNHRYFQDSLAKEMQRHTRTGRELGLLMVDIDHFKRINDTYGHPVGDEILKALVEDLLTNARETDVVARYGGEEFAIILPESSFDAACNAARRLRELVASRSFHPPQLSEPLSITISVGVATFPVDATTPADLVARADEALYEAKKGGRNRVSIARLMREAKAIRPTPPAAS